MAIDGVNQNSNTGLYTGLATAIGAGAGVGAAYLTKPYLKDDAPSDSFVKQVEDYAISQMNDADKKAVEDLTKKIEEQTKQMENMNVKSSVIEDSLVGVDEAKVKELKDTSKLSQFIKDNFGLDVEAKDLDTKDMEKVDDLKAILEKHVDEAKLKEFGKGELISDVLKANSADIKDPEKIAKALKDKGFDVEASALEDLKTAADADAAKKIIAEKVPTEKIDFCAPEKAKIEESIKNLKDERAAKLPKVADFWDATNKQFINTESGKIGAAAKNIASKIQGKYAAIYGGIGAAVAGLITFFATRNKGDEAVQEGLDTEA